MWQMHLWEKCDNCTWEVLKPNGVVCKSHLIGSVKACYKNVIKFILKEWFALRWRGKRESFPSRENNMYSDLKIGDWQIWGNKNGYYWLECRL